MTGLLGNAVIVPEEEEAEEEAVAGGSGWVVSRCVNISPSYMFITPQVRKLDGSYR